MKIHLLVVLLMMPFTGCLESEDEENLDRYVIASGTASYENATSSSVVMEYQYIGAYEDSMETWLNEMMIDKPDMTREEALEVCRCNSTHGSGLPYNETWADYNKYGWEINLVSGEGTWDVFWLNYENTIRANSEGPAFWNSSFSKLDQRGMSNSGSKGPVDKPEQTCSGDPDNNWLTPYGFSYDCEKSEQSLMFDDIYLFMIVNTGDTAFVLEWSIYGWK